jgi:hypothetical protein
MVILFVIVFAVVLHYGGLTPALLWLIIALGLIALKHRDNAGRA